MRARCTSGRNKQPSDNVFGLDMPRCPGYPCHLLGVVKSAKKNLKLGKAKKKSEPPSGIGPGKKEKTKTFQQFLRVTSIGSLPPEKLQKIPRTPAEPRRDPAEPTDPRRAPLRGISCAMGLWVSQCDNVTRLGAIPLPLACELGMRYPPCKRGISAILARYHMTVRKMSAIPPLR